MKELKDEALFKELLEQADETPFEIDLEDRIMEKIEHLPAYNNAFNKNIKWAATFMVISVILGFAFQIAGQQIITAFMDDQTLSKIIPYAKIMLPVFIAVFLLIQLDLILRTLAHQKKSF